MTTPIPADDLVSETLGGFNLLVGYRLVEWRDDFARLDLLLESRHFNRSGFVHGGVVTTMLDFALNYAGVFNTDPGRVRRAVTLTVTTSFLKSAKSGRISCAARRRGGGKTIFTSTGQVTDEEGNVIALGEGTFRYIADLESQAL